MSSNVSAVRSVPGRSFNTTRCRHPSCNEMETLGYVLGFCREMELLCNNRHHKARIGIAESSSIMCGRTQSKELVLDPTIRFERDALQAQHVDEKKKYIYESCIPYLSEKYNIPTSQWSVSGLLFAGVQNADNALECICLVFYAKTQECARAILGHSSFAGRHLQSDAAILQVNQPPLPPTIEDPRVRITEVIALVDGPMLQRVWQEIDYRLDVCRVTQGAHIEHM
ncbi:hypothetical protein ANN_16514 [Periplaneta americana]|uniref:Uncharacterized protein n=1 Tax=Periplaneta americana TaxID=6978 RepID=A0ABQ8SQK8_PERAM|nr:hypothetical protein ANN_16514 [Periplaneta americana]